MNLLLPLLLACSGGDKVVDGPSFDDTDAAPPSPCEGTARVSLSVPTGPLSGDVPLTLTLSHADSEPADVTLTFAADQATFRPLTVTGPTTALASSPAGTAHTLTWHSVDDLGYESYHPTLEAVARSASCNPWPLARLRDVAVDNTSQPVPTCQLSFTDVERPIEGLAIVRLTAAHPAAATATVQLSWSTDGTTFTPTRLQPLDCDADGLPDTGTSLALTREPRPLCLTWDSQADLDVDTTVTLRAT